MDVAALALPCLVGLIARRAALRFPQRPARRGQLDRHHRVDARAAAAIRGALGGVLQLHRLPVLRPARRRRRSAPASSMPASSIPQVIFGALMGAIVWNIVTWVFGIPSSSSHALIGGLVGAGVAKAGFSARGLERPVEDGRGHRPVAAHRLPARAAAGAGRVLDLRARDAVRGRPDASASCSSSRPRSTRSAMAATTRRRPWASSRCCSTRRATSAATSTCRSGWCSPARRRWRSARCSAAGASCTRWARRSPG